MIIAERQGNIFNTRLNTITIPTNAKGVMGAGLAKQARERYPGVFKVYRKIHRTIGLTVHEPFIIPIDDKRNVLIFPTKLRWQEPSRVQWIEHNLWHLQVGLDAGWFPEITGLAIPPVGCGHGQINFDVV